MWVNLISWTILVGTAIILFYTAYVINSDKKAKIILEINHYYAQEEMLDGMHTIQKYYEIYTKGEKVDMKKLKENFITHRKRLDTHAYNADKARRKFSHHLSTIYLLNKHKTINKRLLKDLTHKYIIEFLKKYIEPLEEELVGYKEITKEKFDFFYSLNTN
jgi:hypothetical protein